MRSRHLRRGPTRGHLPSLARRRARLALLVLLVAPVAFGLPGAAALPPYAPVEVELDWSLPETLGAGPYTTELPVEVRVQCRGEGVLAQDVLQLAVGASEPWLKVRVEPRDVLLEQQPCPDAPLVVAARLHVEVDRLAPAEEPVRVGLRAEFGGVMVDDFAYAEVPLAGVFELEVPERERVAPPRGLALFPYRLHSTLNAPVEVRFELVAREGRGDPTREVLKHKMGPLRPEDPHARQEVEDEVVILTPRELRGERGANETSVFVYRLTATLVSDPTRVVAQENVTLVLHTRGVPAAVPAAEGGALVATPLVAAVALALLRRHQA